ncbi:8564_t:CDS:2 [Ambispora gerdemannii]|uniref:8564_t:CDS:1 n=1 Tax=Ambispora gerdemannii TaxID=144530 RepID=A0A9N9BBA4_9GLOM|nr:8564_t:CDS:2 [Ambispora gerdemannii]
MSRAIVLFYHDVVLYKDDFELLNEHQWLNDTCIEFYMEYLEKTKLIPQKNEEEDRLTIFLLRPGLTFLISNIQDAQFLASALPREIYTAEIIFMPINNNPNPTRAGGGTHWSLVVYLRAQQRFLHYDSVQGFNIAVARAAVERVADLLDVKEISFLPMLTPQQDNGADCGVFVISIIDYLVNRILTNSTNFDTDREMQISSTNEITSPGEMRLRLRQLVEQLRGDSQSLR